MANGNGIGKRVALVVGNSAYKNVGALANPKHDAAAMVAVLQELGFADVISAIDVVQAELIAKLQEFYGKLDGSGTALLFYAGHGVQVWGQNYLLPCDTRIDQASDLRTNTIALNDVVRAISRRANTRLLFLDACRNDPLSGEAGGLTRGARSVSVIGSDIADVGQGLAKITATAGTFVAYATEPGNVALDGTGTNSPFTTALLRYVGEPGLTVDDIMMQVRVDVLGATEGKQLPWSESALTKRFEFKEGTAQNIHRDFEQEYWDRVKNTDNPDFLESFLRQFPNSRYAEEARNKIGGVRAHKETADWTSARSVDTIAALADFARRYPTSKNAAAARSRLFVRQLRHGSTIFGAGVAGAIALAAMLLAVLIATLSLAMRYVPGEWTAAIRKDPVQELGPIVYSLMNVLAPSIVFGTLLWSGLTRYASRPFARIALTLSVAAGPAIIIQLGPHLLSPWSPTNEVIVSATERTRELEKTIDEGKKDPRYANDPILKQEVARHEQALKQIYRTTYPARVYRPLATSLLAGLAACWVLFLTALVISGRKGLPAWETPIVAGVLLAIIGGMVFNSVTVDDPSWYLIETLSYSCWVPVAACAALGVSRAAAIDH